jgi:hypothetical protein
MPRKPTDFEHVNLRINNALHGKLTAAAKRRSFTLTNEIRWRLEASLEAEDHRDLTRIVRNLEAAWLRLSVTEKLLALGDALATAQDETQRKLLARQWQAMRQTLKHSIEADGAQQS